MGDFLEGFFSIIFEVIFYAFAEYIIPYIIAGPGYSIRKTFYFFSGYQEEGKSEYNLTDLILSIIFYISLGYGISFLS